ncbi:MAG: YfcE family phosphodiesterase [Bacilli bacterium]|nr:YfcE family phosphodiesterase [Bacilli bacterium]
MKILIVSDSHGHDEILRKVAGLHPDCDFYLHAGDSQSDAENIRPFVSVKGNCDFFHRDYQSHYELMTPLGKLYMEHIPFYQMDFSDLKKANIKIYVCGHTHMRKYEIIDGIHLINPGSLAYPRDGKAGYAIVEITEQKFDYKFYDLSL